MKKKNIIKFFSPFPSFHHEMFFGYVGRRAYKNVKYLFEIGWDLCGDEILYTNLYYAEYQMTNADEAWNNAIGESDLGELVFSAKNVTFKESGDIQKFYDKIHDIANDDYVSRRTKATGVKD